MAMIHGGQINEVTMPYIPTEEGCRQAYSDDHDLNVHSDFLRHRDPRSNPKSLERSGTSNLFNR